MAAVSQQINIVNRRFENSPFYRQLPYITICPLYFFPLSLFGSFYGPIYNQSFRPSNQDPMVGKNEFTKKESTIAVSLSKVIHP